MRQVRIVDALEVEKRKISKELEEMQKKRALRENQIPKNCESDYKSEHILDVTCSLTVGCLVKCDFNFVLQSHHSGIP